MTRIFKRKGFFELELLQPVKARLVVIGFGEKGSRPDRRIE